MSKVKKSVPGIPKGLTDKITRETEAVLDDAFDLARSIFNRPELGYEEYFASDALCSFLSDRGFELERPVAGMDTAFIANKTNGRGPAVGYLAEMDALPSLGHACGHHLIAASSAGAALVLARAVPEARGSIRVIGCPAEEGGGGKLYLAREGVFDGLAAALIVHPDRRTEVYKRSLGVIELELDFRGRAAHASAEPEAGINALDAVLQTFNAVSMLRQQLHDKIRIHGIITNGGVKPNIIPERASALFMARGLTVDETLSVADKVAACARGAAKAAGCKVKVKYRRDTMYAPYVPNRTLGSAFAEALDYLGVAAGGGPEDEGMGSTDVGDVCLRAPTLHPLLAVPGAKEGVHTHEFARAASGPGGKEALRNAILANAMVGARVMTDKSFRDRAAEEYCGSKG